MSMMRMNYRSQALGYYVDVSIVFPTDNLTYYAPQNVPGTAGLVSADGKQQYRPGMKFQTVYLIHGGSDDDTLTYRYTNAERYAQRNNVMLVTPDIANSFGVDTCYGQAYQTFIAEELPIVIQSLFASSAAREDNFIMGYAMGGNVALGTAIMHPDKFAACVDLSGGIGMTLSTETLKSELDGDHFRNRFRIYNTTFGESRDIDGSRFDIRRQAEAYMADGVERSKFFIACGSREFIRERVEEDVRLLREIGYDVNYEVAEGYDHNFDMWDRYIAKALDEYLPLKRRAIDPV